MTSFGARQVVEQEPDSEHKFLQLYFIDNYESQVTARCNITANLNRDLVRSLQDLLHAHNHYIQSFKAALETLPQNHADYRVIIHSDKLPPEEHERRYNAPMTNEVALLMMLQKAFKDDCISRSQSGKWHKAFKKGREEVADEPRSGRPTTARTDEDVDRVLEVLRTDRRLSIQQIADTLHMSTFVVHGIVTEDLQMRKVCAKLVTKVLTQDQKELRVLRYQELLDLIQNEPDFLNSVVTGDESWMFEYDPESKRQSCAWHTKSSPRPKKARMKKSRIKTIIIVFFDIRGIVHCEFVPQGQTVNSVFYLEVLRRLKRRISRVRTDIKDTVKLHHDNATSHTAFIITNFLARSNTPLILDPPYSPELAPCDFFLFPRLKREMEGKHWETV
ncbi:hypothetical protein LAZ67_2000982 [Cordylochernes scorpioides]|uniref:Transposase n=1 Tax=Cordylochernes scorpioides TaxID=51811 RepID=A0ABY6K156_9ARAC|nr:hypothetical protein LAZ67_2000982 [Cordylochernes scorpioides]